MFWDCLRLGVVLTNNDILRCIRKAFDFDENTVIEIFSLADFNVTEVQVSTWLRGDGESVAQITDSELSLFLNGFINLKRGKSDSVQPKPEDSLNNNVVFKKLRIALDLKSEDILEIFQRVDLSLSKHELSSFFRKPGNKHYRECDDRIIQKFLLGVQASSR